MKTLSSKNIPFFIRKNEKQLKSGERKIDPIKNKKKMKNGSNLRREKMTLLKIRKNKNSFIK